MPHFSNLDPNFDVLPHLYLSDPRAGVDHANNNRSVARIGNIDLRTEKGLKDVALFSKFASNLN